MRVARAGMLKVISCYVLFYSVSALVISVGPQIQNSPLWQMVGPLMKSGLLILESFENQMQSK